MTTAPETLRARIVGIHGAIAFLVGLVFLYLRGTMTNPIFEAIVVVIAITLAAASLIMAAIVDWVAAFTTRARKIHQFVFYLLAALAFGAAALFIGYYSALSLQLLVLIAAVHAFVFGAWNLFFAISPVHRPRERLVLVFIALVSFGFAVLLAFGRQFDNLQSMTALGAYTCFVGIKMLFLAWDLGHASMLSNPART